jgi:hypothetical protein
MSLNYERPITWVVYPAPHDVSTGGWLFRLENGYVSQTVFETEEYAQQCAARAHSRAGLDANG